MNDNIKIAIIDYGLGNLRSVYGAVDKLGHQTYITNDIEKLEKTIADVGKQQEQLQANMFALHGALQQCDQFLEILSKESKEDE